MRILTQTRTDNDQFTSTMVVLEPYVAQIQVPSEISRALQENTKSVNITVTNTGSRSALWTLTYDDSNLPDGWSFSPNNSADLSVNLESGENAEIEFEFSVPLDAVGSDDALIPLTLHLTKTHQFQQQRLYLLK